MLGIIGAMEEEVDKLKANMDQVNVKKKASMEFYQGTIQGKEVVVVRSGIGKVNAGICTQILAALLDVTHIINTGVAGSLNAALDIGDILVSRDAMHHDMDVSALGYEPGIVPQMDTSVFKADEGMVESALEICKEVNPDIHVMSGRIVI